MKTWDGQVAVVTGGASGLGLASARALSALNCKVILFDLNAEIGAAAAREIGAHFIEVDVTSTDQVSAAFAEVTSNHGTPRIMVNCAGIAPAAKTVSRGAPHDPVVFQSTIAVNLIGTFHCASQAASLMSSADPLDADGTRGVIINTASVAAFDGQIGQIAYAASKGGVVGMTLPMARDLADKGIRVCAIAPGLFLTPMLEGLPQDVQDNLGAQVPFPARLGNPTEFAQLVCHIVENPMLNGEVIRLDGAIRMAPR